MNTLSKGVLVALGLVTLASCGGGGGGVASGGTGGTGITGVSQGPISGFGSVYVNGVRIHTGGAAITVDDNPGQTQAALGLGMVVTVNWTEDNAGVRTATAIRHTDDIQGPVTVIDSGAGTLTVLGQPVIVSAQTVFMGDGLTPVTSLATLPLNRIVEVSGLRDDSTGRIRATRIELKTETAGLPEYELKGIVSAAGNGTFTLGAQVVSFATPPGVGACVEVKGTSLVAGVLTALSVDLEDSCTLGGGTISTVMTVELEGYVSELVNASNFKVNGRTVQVAANAVYDDRGVPSLSPISIANGARVEVEGKMNSSGVLIATKVSLDPELGERPESSIGMEVVAGDAMIGNTATTLTVYGITVTVNDSTRFEGILRDLSNISVHSLEIDAYASGTTVIATRISRKETDEPELQGPVTADSIVGMTSLRILGVTVSTNSATQYRDINDVMLTPSQFFAQAAASGALVKAKGMVSGSAMAATELGIED